MTSNDLRGDINFEDYDKNISIKKINMFYSFMKDQLNLILRK